jgi:hypothetical protein
VFLFVLGFFLSPCFLLGSADLADFMAQFLGTAGLVTEKSFLGLMLGT